MLALRYNVKSKEQVSYFPVLLFLNDYLKGTGYGFGGANVFAHSTPFGALIAPLPLQISDGVIYLHQGIAGANTNTQLAAVAFFQVYYRHICRHHYPRLLIININLKHTICL